MYISKHYTDFRTWHESSSSSSSSSSSTAFSSFSMGLKRVFFISLSRISGLAALISIFRLAVGVQGSGWALSVCLIGVIWVISGLETLLCPLTAAVTDSHFSGVVFLRSVQMFSWNQGISQTSHEEVDALPYNLNAYFMVIHVDRIIWACLIH